MIEEIKEKFIQKMKMLKQRIEVRENNPCYHDETETLKRFHERLGVYEELEQSFMYLIGEVDRLEKEKSNVHDWREKAAREASQLRGQVEELQKALEWYSDEHNYDVHSEEGGYTAIEIDRGYIARQALERTNP